MGLGGRRVGEAVRGVFACCADGDLTSRGMEYGALLWIINAGITQLCTEYWYGKRVATKFILIYTIRKILYL